MRAKERLLVYSEGDWEESLPPVASDRETQLRESRLVTNKTYVLAARISRSPIVSDPMTGSRPSGSIAASEIEEKRVSCPRC